LNPELDPEWEEEQDFIETTGIKRVVQAMHAHLWPNLQMKGKKKHLIYIFITLLICSYVLRCWVFKKNQLTEASFYWIQCAVGYIIIIVI
jgi:hypothetical protein